MFDLTTIQLMNIAAVAVPSYERAAIDSGAIRQLSREIATTARAFHEPFVDALDLESDTPKGPVIG